MIFQCSICKKHVRSTDGLCRTCRKYLRDGNALFSPDQTKGRQERFGSGRYACKICGKVFDNLSSHISQVHRMTIAEYKSEFGLSSTTRLSKPNKQTKPRKPLSEESKEKLRHNLEIARKRRDEYREELKKQCKKRVETHKITEKDRERRRNAMILLNLKKKLTKSVDCNTNM